MLNVHFVHRRIIKYIIFMTHLSSAKAKILNHANLSLGIVAIFRFNSNPSSQFG